MLSVSLIPSLEEGYPLQESVDAL